MLVPNLLGDHTTWKVGVMMMPPAMAILAWVISIERLRDRSPTGVTNKPMTHNDAKMVDEVTKEIEETDRRN